MRFLSVSKTSFLYPRYSFLSLSYRFMISKISSMDNPVVREAAFTNRQYFLGASTLIIFMPFPDQLRRARVRVGIYLCASSSEQQ